MPRHPLHMCSAPAAFPLLGTHHQDPEDGKHQ